MVNSRSCSLLIALAVSSAGTMAAQTVDTVRVGGAALRHTRLTEGTQVVESYRLDDEGRTVISTTTQTVNRESWGAVEIYRIHTVHVSNDTTVGTIIVRANDLSLLHHRVKATRDSAAVSASEGALTGWVVLPDEPIRLIDLPLAHRVFPVEGQVPWLFPLLPLREGYAAAVPHFSEWEGAETWKTVRVLGSEPVELAGETIECWKVDAGPLGPPGYRATAWVDKRTRRVVRSSLRGEGGGPEYWAVARPR